MGPSSRSTSSRSRFSTRRPARWLIFPMRAPRRAASRRSTPASPSAATADTSTPAWHRSPTLKAKARTTRAAGSRCTALRRARSRPERLIPLPVDQLAAGTKDSPARRIGQRQGHAVPGGDCGLGAGRPREAAGRRQSLRRCGASRCRDAAPSKSASIFPRAMPCPSTYPIALAVTSDGKRAFVALWNASEIVELDLDARHGGAQADSAQAVQSRCAGNASLRLRLLARRENALRGAGQSRRRCGRQRGRRAVQREGLLRYAAAGAELLRRGAGGAGRERTMAAGSMWPIWAAMRLRCSTPAS